MEQARKLLIVAVFVLAPSGCADSTTPDPVGGETHFLRSCDTDEACGLGLECVCGVCTKPCSADNTCKNESTLATCKPAGTPSGACINPQASPVCDVECTGATDCASLGSGYTCESGSCRKLSANACVLHGAINTSCTDAGTDSAVHDAGIDSGTPPGSCLFDGTRHANGAQFTVDCNTCECADGMLNCTTNNCFSCTPVDADAGTGPIEWAADPNPLQACDFNADLRFELIATSFSPIRYMYLDHDDVYWFAYDDDPSPHRTRKEGDRETGTTVNRSLSDGISAAEVADCRLYVTWDSDLTAQSVDVGFVSPDSLDATVLATLPMATNSGRVDMLTDNIHVYVAVGSTLVRVRRTGGPVTTLANIGESSTATPALIVDANDRIYWVHHRADPTVALDEIRSIPKDLSSEPVILTGGLTSPQWMARRGDHLYVATRGTYDTLGNHQGNASIVRVSLVDGAQMVLATTAEELHVAAADDTHVYWVERVGTEFDDSAIYRIPLDGGPGPEVVLSPVPASRLHLEVDATHLYWITTCPSTDAWHSIVRAPKP